MPAWPAEPIGVYVSIFGFLLGLLSLLSAPSFADIAIACAALDLPEAGETGPATSDGPRVPFLFYAFELR